MSIGTGLYASLQYLEAPFRIRVSKSIIGNTSGGSAFIGNTRLGYSVNTVVASFMEKLLNGNFTTSTVNKNSSYGLSSATKAVSDPTLTQLITSGRDNEI